MRQRELMFQGELYYSGYAIGLLIVGVVVLMPLAMMSLKSRNVFRRSPDLLAR